MSRRTVVTGMGISTPFGGKTVEADWLQLMAGNSARQKIDFFDISHSRCQEAAFSKNFFSTPNPLRASELATHALHQALLQANLLDQNQKLIDSQIPFSVSTTAGAMAMGEKFVRDILHNKRRGLLKTIHAYQGQQQVLTLQQKFGIRGRSHIVCNACASGANAIGHGHQWIQAGWSDCVIVGGFEALTELLFYGFDCLQSLAPDSCKPFDRDRNGLMLGEGAGFLVLEEEAHALHRGASILGVIAGYGQRTDAHHLTQPHPEGIALAQAIQEALLESQIAPEEIGYLNSHGTGTPMNDGAEAHSYQKALGSALPRIQVSSTKAMTGHTLGAAGVIEAIFALLALRDGKAPPQINCAQPLPELENSLALSPRPSQNWKASMSVNLGFGGSNAALIFSKFEGSPERLK